MKKRTIIVLTVINVAVFIFALFCFIGTGINNKIFNSIESFTYRETENGVVFVTENGQEIPIQFSGQGVRVLQTKQKTGRKESLEIVRFYPGVCKKERLCVSAKEYGTIRRIPLARNIIQVWI